MLASICFLTVALYIGWKASLIIHNYTIAKTMGLRIIISPIEPHSLLWMLLNMVMDTISYQISWDGFMWLKVSKYSWQFQEKCRTHEKLGKCFVVVTPSGNELFVADAAVIAQVLAKKGGFEKPMKMLGKCQRPETIWK